MLSNLLLILSLSAFAQPSLKCEKGVIRETTDAKTVETKTTYCFNEDKNILTSTSCKTLNCPLAFNTKKNLDLSKLQNQTSNPGFNICRELEGKPQIVEFKVGSDWHRLDRCTFKDGSFVSTSELAGFYLKPRR